MRSDSPAAKRCVFFIIPFANLVPSMMVATLGIALPEVRRSLLLSELAAGGLFSVIFMIATLSSGLAGRLADRIGSKTVLIAGLSILACGFALAGLSGHRSVIFFFLGVTGLGYGFIPTSLYTLMSDVAPERKGLASSLVAVAYGLGGAIGSIVASRLIAIAGWREAFITVGIIAIVVMVLELGLVPRGQRRQAAASSGPMIEALSRPLILLAAAEFLAGSVFWSTASWTATLLRGAKGLTLGETGWVMGVWSLSQIFGALLLGHLSDRFGRKFMILVSAFPAALLSFVVYSWLASPMALGIGFLLFGTLRASAPTLVVALAQETTSAANAGTATGMIMALHYASAVVTPLATAQLITTTGDITLALILATTVPMLSYGALIGAVRDRRRVMKA